MSAQTAALMYMDAFPGGVSRDEIGEHLGLNTGSLRYLLTAMSKAGLIGSVRVSNNTTAWATARHLPAIIAATTEKVERYKRERANARYKARNERKKAARQAPQVDQEDDGSIDSWPVLRSIVSAKDAAPIRKTGPASVWELAA